PAVALLLLAGALYGGVALPAKRASVRLEAERARIQTEADPLRRQLTESEPRRLAQQAWLEAAQRADGSVTAVRRRVLGSLDGAPVSAVRLSVVAAQPPLAARTRFAALGSFPDLVGLADRMIGPRTGVAPERVRLAPSGSQVSLELDGVVLGRLR
ncbi:MAG TPA: hypothetical protein VI669_10535, partial [Vicinamibacteria bacterium]